MTMKDRSSCRSISWMVQMLGWFRDEARACFAAKSLDRVWISGQVFRQELQRHGAAQFKVLGLVDHAHSAPTEFTENAVVRDDRARAEAAVLRWRSARLIANADWPAISIAGFSRKPSALCSSVNRSVLPAPVGSLPAHASRRNASRSSAAVAMRRAAAYRVVSSVPNPSTAPPPSSRYSQNLAMLQSRRTVAGETLSTSAVSSTLSPPKKRISMIRTLRGSRRASAFRASSSATRSPGSAVTHDGNVIEGDVRHSGPALYVMTACMVDQDAPHHLGRHREEMGAILPFHALVVHQPHVGFIHQGGGLQGVPRAFALHVVVSQAAKLVINDRGQALNASWSPSLQARRSLLISFVFSSSGIAGGAIRIGQLYRRARTGNFGGHG